MSESLPELVGLVGALDGQPAIHDGELIACPDGRPDLYAVTPNDVAHRRARGGRQGRAPTSAGRSSGQASQHGSRSRLSISPARSSPTLRGLVRGRVVGDYACGLFGIREVADVVTTARADTGCMSDNLPVPVLTRPLHWGEPPVGDGDFLLPTGTVTLLLADVEGSTRGWETDPEAMARAITRLNEIVDEQVGRNDGVRPVEQGEGVFVAAFAQARDAVACALAIQRALAGGDVAVRMGVHTGERATPGRG